MATLSPNARRSTCSFGYGSAAAVASAPQFLDTQIYADAPKNRLPARHNSWHAGGMDNLTDNDLFLDAVDAIVLDALARVGDDPRARFTFFKKLLAVAKEVAKERGQ